MELHIINRNSLITRRHPRLLRLLLHQQLIIHAQLTLGHPRKQTLQLDGPGDLRPKHRALHRHQTMHLLNHINKYFVSFMHNPLGPPARHPRRLRRQLSELLEVFQQILIEAAFLDELLEDFRVHDLWATEVHHFVEDLINQREVLLDLLLVELAAEVGLADED